MAIDFKKAAVDHVEKAVFGIVIIVVLLGLVGTNWKPYEGTPQEIHEAVRKGKTNLYANTWPEDEQTKYSITQEIQPKNVLDRTLFADMSPTGMEFPEGFVKDPAGGQDPVTEPTLLKVEDLINSSSRVFIQVASTPAEEETEETDTALAAADTEDDTDVPDEFRQSSQALGRGGMYEGYEGYDDLAVELDDPGYSSYEGMEEAYSDAGYEGYEGLGGEGMGMSRPTVNGEGFPFVSVRGVFPLRDQIRKYADAIHRPFHEAAASFEIRDFELERQTKQPGDDPWSGEWEKVDLQVAADVLEKADGYVPDVFNGMVTDSVITMPLPMRVFGEWRNQVTHPRVAKFELSDDQIRFEVEMQKRMLTELVEQQKTLEASETKRGGFSNFVFDNRQMQSALTGGDSYEMEFGNMGMGSGNYGEYMGSSQGRMSSGRNSFGARNSRTAALSRNDPREKLVQQLMKGSNDKEQEKMIREWIQGQASVEGELLLFRYIDFNVESGKTYRYRVRLVLNNPNFGKRIAEAGGLSHVVEGETRLTDWSEPTTPVKVDEEVRYFVTGAREPTGKVLPNVRMDVFQYDKTHGTTMNDEFEVRIGQNIRDEVETLVIDPAQVVFEEKDYQFKSQDYLVDAIDDITVDLDFHAGENVPEEYRIKLAASNGRLGLPTQAVVADSGGKGLKVLGAGQSSEHKALKKYEERQREFFDYLKKPEGPALGEEGYEGLMGEGYEDAMMEMMMGGGRSQTGRNVLRKGSRGSTRGRTGGRSAAP